MKKEMVIYGNCHTTRILKYLSSSATLNKLYNINHVYIVNFLEKNKFDDCTIEIFKNADVLIGQYIEQNRGELNHEYILQNFIKKDCNVILFPHFRFDGYVLGNNIFKNFKTSLFYAPLIPLDIFKLYLNSNNYDKFDDNFQITFDNVEIISKEKINELLVAAFDAFKIVNDKSTIDMFDFVKNNYKKQRLFGMRGYPTGIFFHELAKKMLEKMEIFDITEYRKETDCVYNEWNHTLIPIVPKLYDALELEHDTKYDKMTVKCKDNCTYLSVCSLSEYYFKTLKEHFNDYGISKLKCNVTNNPLNCHYPGNLNALMYGLLSNYDITHSEKSIVIKENKHADKIYERLSFFVLSREINKETNTETYNITILVEAYDDNTLINTFNFFDGIKWHIGIKSLNNLKTFNNLLQPPRINIDQIGIITIKKIDVVYN